MLNRLIRRIFEYIYDDYLYPFLTADMKLQRMESEKRLRYYNDARDFLNSPCYENEMQGLIRNMYRDLSTKTLTETEIASYRMTLIWIKQFEARLNFLSNQYERTVHVNNNLRN